VKNKLPRISTLGIENTIIGIAAYSCMLHPYNVYSVGHLKHFQKLFHKFWRFFCPQVEVDVVEKDFNQTDFSSQMRNKSFTVDQCFFVHFNMISQGFIYTDKIIHIAMRRKWQRHSFTCVGSFWRDDSASACLYV
jgi:hypothetical protein